MIIWYLSDAFLFLYSNTSCISEMKELKKKNIVVYVLYFEIGHFGFYLCLCKLIWFKVGCLKQEAPHKV